MARVGVFIEDTSVLLNVDSLVISNSDYSIEVRGMLENNNLIKVENGEETGLQLYSGASLQNTSSASIEIEALDATVIIQEGGIMDLHGTIITNTRD